MLGHGRIHHCMRALRAAERALAPMVERTFGRALPEQGVVQQSIAKSRVENPA